MRGRNLGTGRWPLRRREWANGGARVAAERSLGQRSPNQAVSVRERRGVEVEQGRASANAEAGRGGENAGAEAGWRKRRGGKRPRRDEGEEQKDRPVFRAGGAGGRVGEKRRKGGDAEPVLVSGTRASKQCERAKPEENKKSKGIGRAEQTEACTKVTEEEGTRAKARRRRRRAGRRARRSRKWRGSRRRAGVSGGRGADGPCAALRRQKRR